MNTSGNSTKGRNDGLLDTNLFVHAMTADEQSRECRAFLAAVARGEQSARLEMVVLHELSYVLPRYRKQMDRAQLADYLSTVIEWPGVLGDKGLLLDTVERWSNTPGLSFVDAHLAALAANRGCPVYTKNVRELRAQGITVPDPLISHSQDGEALGGSS